MMLRLALPLLFVCASTTAQAAQSPERLKISDVAVVSRADQVRSSMYPEWSGEASAGFDQLPPSSLFPRSSLFSAPPILSKVRGQMIRAASLAGEEQLVHLLEEDDLRWNAIVASVDQLATDPNTAFVSRSHGLRLDKAVGMRFIESVDPWRVVFSSRDVSKLLSDRKGLTAAVSGENLAWIDRVATAAHASQSALVQDAIDRFQDVPVDGSLPSYCRASRGWELEPKRFVRPDRLERHRLDGFCDSLSARLVPAKEGVTPEKALSTLRQEYVKMMDKLSEPRQDAHYLSFVLSRLSVLDPHSTYVPATGKSDFSARMAAAYVGLGVNVSFSAGLVSFSSVNESGPAYEAGVRAGDQLLSIGPSPGAQVPVANLTSEQLLAMMSGVDGGEVWMNIKDSAGVEVEKVVRRRRVEVRSARVQSSRLPPTADRPGVMHVRANSFYRDVSDPDRPGGSTTSDIRRALDLALPGDWVLLDLRGNGGGLLEEALGVSGLFLPAAPVVQVQSPSGEVLSLSARPGHAWEGPLLLLVDRATGSASEIVAAALQDYGRAILLGEPTFGKGTAQSLFDLDGWAGVPAPVYGQVNLTTMRFFRPSGGSTQLVGVVPDIAFMPSHGGGRERSLDRAMRQSSLPALPLASSRITSSCLSPARHQASRLWSGSAWSTSWDKALEEIKRRPVALNARKQFIDDRVKAQGDLQKSLSSLPGADAPLFVTLSVLPLLAACPTTIAAPEIP